jgi:hypothetical protein
VDSQETCGSDAAHGIKYLDIQQHHVLGSTCEGALAPERYDLIHMLFA